eukprot:905878-Rhodomonas_salina.2
MFFSHLAPPSQTGKPSPALAKAIDDSCAPSLPSSLPLFRPSTSQGLVVPQRCAMQTVQRGGHVAVTWRSRGGNVAVACFRFGSMDKMKEAFNAAAAKVCLRFCWQCCRLWLQS